MDRLQASWQWWGDSQQVPVSVLVPVQAEEAAQTQAPGAAAQKRAAAAGRMLAWAAVRIPAEAVERMQAGVAAQMQALEEVRTQERPQGPGPAPGQAAAGRALPEGSRTMPPRRQPAQTRSAEKIL
jgi:hypothetical protein